MAFANVMLVVLLVSALLMIKTKGDFPRNQAPKTVINLSDVPVKAFTGDEVTPDNRLSYLQLVKRIRMGTNDMLAIASRDQLYFINPEKLRTDNIRDIQYDNVITWKSKNMTRELCSMKGQTEELCHNFLSVVATTNDEGSELLVCGTNSFSPICTTYTVSYMSSGLVMVRGEDFSGKQRCPYGPNQPSAAIFTGGSLYAGTYQAFTGVSPVVSRSMGDNTPLKTASIDEAMNRPRFVKMIEDDKRVLVFFNEMQKLSSGEVRMVAQVGQVCKNDVGGDRVLSRMWTTFIKSRLNCSYNGFYLNELRDVTEAKFVNGVETIFATFSTPEDSLAGAAVCSFTMNAIREALHGAFLVGSDPSAQTVGTSPAASRHPASCPSEKMTDSELFFIKSHPQMKEQVPGSLLMTNQGSRWTTIALDTKAGPNDVTVIIVGTEDGQIIKGLGPNQMWEHGAIISKQDVFDSNRCSSGNPEVEDRRVLSILVDAERGFLLVGFKHCVVTVPLRTCGVHNCQEECVGSADPYCGWEVRSNSCVPYLTANQGLAQNVAGALKSPESYGACQPEVEENTNSFVEVQKPIVEVEEMKPKNETTKPEGRDALVPKVNCVTGVDPCSSKFDLVVVIVAGVGGFIFGVFLTIILIVLYRKKVCCSGFTSNDDDFKKKQLKQQHLQAMYPDDRRGSLTRTARKTYFGWKEWFCRSSKPNTPAATPSLNNKLDQEHPAERRPRRLNDYSEAPTLKSTAQPNQHAPKPRRMSSRHNSTSSNGSVPNGYPLTRQASVLANGPIVYEQGQPLLLNNQTDEAYYSPTTECILTNEMTEAPTLPHPKRISHASMTGEYPITSLHGAAESGQLPTASTKMRRRNEKATSQTNEIMRESDTAIRSFETTLHHMQQQGIPVDNSRERLNSNDSGKGESVRNSMRTELEPIATNASAFKQRPTSLNLPQNGVGHRRRLTSEPSYPNDVITPTGSISSGSSSGRRNPPVRQHSFGFHQSSSTRSQPTTPVGGAPGKLSVYHPKPSEASEVGHYATLPKNEQPQVGRRKERQHQQRHHMEQLHERLCPRLQQEFMQQQQQHQQQQQQQQMHKAHMIQEVMKNPRTTEHQNQRRGVVTRSCGSPGKHPAPPLNRYPSLQVRGPNAYQEYQRMPMLKNQPINHYPSLPHGSSTSPYGKNSNNNNTYGTLTAFERPTTLHRREKLPQMMRQSSVPGYAAPKPMYVATPVVPPSGTREM